MSRKVKSLIKQVNQWCESVEEYLQSEDSCEAEFCQTFGYGEDTATLEHLDEYTRALVDTLFKRIKGIDHRNRILAECSELKYVDMYIRNNEIYRTPLGESEQQLPDELEAKLSKLSDAEYYEIRKSVNCYLPERSRSYWNCGYFNHDSSYWVLILNVDSLYRALQDIPTYHCVVNNEIYLRTCKRGTLSLVGGAA